MRKNAASGAGTPTARIELWQNGVLVRAGPNIDVTARSASQQVISLTWDATEILVAAAVECKVIGTKSGGSPANRASVDIGAVEWNAEGAVVGEVIQRLYYPWDLDSVICAQAICVPSTFDIYAGGPGTAYQTIILGNPTLRAQYSQIFNDLLCGPLSEAEIIALVDAIEPLITQALIDDPNNQLLGPEADRFNDIRTWISQRVLNVAGQIEGFVACVACGNGVPEAGEDCSNCPADVQCPAGTECIAGVCVPLTGACCFTGGTCQDGLTDADCVVAGGTYQGNGSVCAKTFCRECALDIDCDDGDPCNGLETCVGGICQPGIPLDCDDANACTADSCDPLVGCINTPINCDDGNACTADSCDPLVGCINTPINPCCGNGVPEAGEDCSNCPADVQCPPNTLCIAGICEVPAVADFTGPDGVPNGCVDAFDFGALLGAWCSEFVPGVPPDPPCENCLPENLFADIAGAGKAPDGCVDAFDLAKLLGDWCSVAGGNSCGTCFP